MSKVRVRLLLAVAALAASVGGYWLAQQLDSAGPRLTSGTWLPQPKAVRDFALTDTTGSSFTRASLVGAPSLVFFGFTRCPDVCPATLLELAQVRKAAALPPGYERVGGHRPERPGRQRADAALRRAAIPAAAALPLARGARNHPRTHTARPGAAHPRLRRPLPPRHERRGAPGPAELRELQRLLHPGARPRRAPDRSRCGLARLAGRRQRESDRAARRLVAGAGQGACLYARVAPGGGSLLGAALQGGRVRDVLPCAVQLPPHPHAALRPAARGVVRAGAAVHRRCRHHRLRSPSLPTPRAPGVRLRAGNARLRPGAGGSPLRRQHRDRVARRGDAAEPAPWRRAAAR